MTKTEALQAATARLVAEYAKGSDAWDHGVITTATAEAMANGPDLRPLGFTLGERGTSMHGNTNEPSQTKKAIFALLKAEGYTYADKGKMVGGSETLHNFIREDLPGIKFQLHIRPYTEWKQKKARMRWSVETTRLRVTR